MTDVYKLAMILASLAAAYVLAVQLTRLRVFSDLDARRGRDVELDGLRGYLALSVFFHHLAVTWRWKATGIWASSEEIYFLNSGKVGVYLFFMITGYLFVGKLLRAGPGHVNWLRLYESRIFRIVPLYAFAVLAITAIVAAATQFQLLVSPATLAQEYLKWGLFHGATINGFADTKNIIAQVDWTLKYEWLFYLALPLIAVGLRSRAGSIALLLVAISLYVAPLQLKQFSSAYGLLFAVGGLAAWIRRRLPDGARPARKIWISWLALAALCGALFYPKTMDPVHVALISVFFITVVLGNDLFGLLTKPASIVLGEMSYSIYLLHGLLLYVLFTALNVAPVGAWSFEAFMAAAPALTVLVVLLSAASYRAIELPGMRLGRRYLITTAISARTGRWQKQPATAAAG